MEEAEIMSFILNIHIKEFSLIEAFPFILMKVAEIKKKLYLYWNY